MSAPRRRLPMVSVYLTRQTLDLVSRAAEAEGLNRTEFIRRVLALHVDGEVSTAPLRWRMEEAEKRLGALEQRQGIAYRLAVPAVEAPVEADQDIGASPDSAATWASGKRCVSSIYLSPEFLHRVDQAAGARGITRAEYIRRAIAAHIGGELPPPMRWRVDELEHRLETLESRNGVTYHPSPVPEPAEVPVAARYRARPRRRRNASLAGTPR